MMKSGRKRDGEMIGRFGPEGMQKAMLLHA